MIQENIIDEFVSVTDLEQRTDVKDSIDDYENINSAYKVFDEMPNRILDEIEAEIGDICTCETHLSEKYEDKVVIHEISEYEKDVIVVVTNDVIVEMNDGKNLVLRYFRNEIGGLNTDIVLEVSHGEVLDFHTFRDVCVGDFWGQKSHKEEVLGMESFGWKPGWVICVRYASEIYTDSLSKTATESGVKKAVGSDKSCGGLFRILDLNQQIWMNHVHKDSYRWVAANKSSRDNILGWNDYMKTYVRWKEVEVVKSEGDCYRGKCDALKEVDVVKSEKDNLIETILGSTMAVDGLIYGCNTKIARLTDLAIAEFIASYLLTQGAVVLITNKLLQGVIRKRSGLCLKLSENGQFGVGLYFIYRVAAKVVMTTKNNDNDQYIWESQTDAFLFTRVTEGEQFGKGTKISLFLKEDKMECVKEACEVLNSMPEQDVVSESELICRQTQSIWKFQVDGFDDGINGPVRGVQCNYVFNMDMGELPYDRDKLLIFQALEGLETRRGSGLLGLFIVVEMHRRICDWLDKQLCILDPHYPKLSSVVKYDSEMRNMTMKIGVAVEYKPADASDSLSDASTSPDTLATEHCALKLAFQEVACVKSHMIPEVFDMVGVTIWPFEDLLAADRLGLTYARKVIEGFKAASMRKVLKKDAADDEYIEIKWLLLMVCNDGMHKEQWEDKMSPTLKLLLCQCEGIPVEKMLLLVWTVLDFLVWGADVHLILWGYYNSKLITLEWVWQKRPGSIEVICSLGSILSIFEGKNCLRRKYCYMLNISYVVVVIVQGDFW